MNLIMWSFHMPNLHKIVGQIKATCYYIMLTDESKTDSEERNEQSFYPFSRPNTYNAC